jgi:hypothetical protein
MGTLGVVGSCARLERVTAARHNARARDTYRVLIAPPHRHGEPKRRWSTTPSCRVQHHAGMALAATGLTGQRIHYNER